MQIKNDQLMSFLDLLEELLRRHPEGLKEWDLVALLKEKELTPFAQANLGDSLVMYQIHFLLFHGLYQLKARLNREGFDLEVHCLKIQILNWRLAEGELAPVDPMQDYYMDWGSYEQTGRLEVEDMLQQFWKGFERYSSKADAYDALGLDEGAGLSEIKNRYRELAQKLHPDAGGTGEGFEKITWAKDILVGKPSQAG